MKILDITSKLPYPLVDGARICMYQTASSLAALGHDVHVVSFDEKETDFGPLADVADVHLVRLNPPPLYLGALATLPKQRPYTQLKRDVAEGHRLVEELHRKVGFDAVLVDEIHVATYGAAMKEKFGLPYVLRCHNVEHEIYGRHAATIANPFMRSYLELQTRRWKRFEEVQMAKADALVAITSRDKETIARLAPNVPVTTIPAAVDLDRFPYVGVDDREENSVVLLGDMKWPPNKEAAIWFSQEIMPLIVKEVPELVVYLIGGNPPLRQLPPSTANFRVEGRVPDVRPYFDRATVGLIPLKVGGGMRVKMVEMMGSGMPVVSTKQGAEGNEATPGEHYLAADDTAGFAAAVVRLLRDRTERRRLSESALRFAEERYSVGQVGRRLESLLESVITRTLRPIESR